MGGWRLVFGLMIAAMLAGCADQSAVSNQTDHFSYGGQASGKDTTESFTWKNTRGGAHVSWGGQASEGSITVTIRDAAGAMVFQDTVSAGQQRGFDADTDSGLTGKWKIHLEFEDFTGQMGLDVSARTGSPDEVGFVPLGTP